MKLASGIIICRMTRRDAALLTLTLAGMWCLYVALMMAFALPAIFAARPESVMVPDPTLRKLFSVLPVAILSCVGMALMQSRRKFSTWIFGANPSHDATAQVDAGDMRLLAVRVVGFLLFARFAQTLPSLAIFQSSVPREIARLRPGVIGSISILAVGCVLCFFRGGSVVRFLFAAGPGEGRSARYRDNLAFALAIIGVFYLFTFIGGVVSGVIDLSWNPDATDKALNFFMRSGTQVVMVVLGILLFIGRRALASLWSKLHPMDAGAP